jgi:DNA-binding NarL/FixJ family response regulator
MIRVLLVDDEALVRDGLRAILEHEEDIDVVGEAGDGRAAVHQSQVLRPDIVLMDVRMPGVDGIAATREVLALPRPPRVVVLTTFDHNEHVYEALHAGASGFLLKDVRRGQLVDAIRQVVAGDTLISPAITRRLIEEFWAGAPRRSPSATRLDDLTGREREVLTLIGLGLNNIEIADRLGVAETTVKTHVARVLAKTASRDRVQAVILAYETALVRPGSAPAVG